ncbi:MAG: hypothetical protein ACO3RB_07045 [Ilumatobacteraceae bacterium]
MPADRRPATRASASSTVPGGVFASRRAVRRRGGLVAIATAAGLWIAGLVSAALINGAAGGVVSFFLLVMALPVMPLLGMPAAGGGTRLLVAVGGSAALWWMLGQVVAGRVTRRPVAGWREWAREFLVLGLGLWVGAAGGLALGALVLGVT